jgi:hypothetical protein
MSGSGHEEEEEEEEEEACGVSGLCRLYSWTDYA